jgi:putative transcriptional regulator
MMGKTLTIASLLAATSLLPAWADDELAQGKILVADRKLKDPNFERSVVYLITYDEMGAVGLILNRETDTPVGKILGGVKGALNRNDFAFSGGPVETNSILALHRTTARRKGAQQVSAEVSAILDETVLKEVLASGGDSSALRFYLGYAGWGPGQLDAEVDAGAWFITSGDAKIVFDADPDTLWDRLIRRKDAVVAGLFSPLSRSGLNLLPFKGRLAHGTQLHPAHRIAGNVPAVCGFQLSLRASIPLLPAQSPRSFLVCNRRQRDSLPG